MASAISIKVPLIWTAHERPGRGQLVSGSALLVAASAAEGNNSFAFRRYCASISRHRHEGDRFRSSQHPPTLAPFRAAQNRMLDVIWRFSFAALKYRMAARGGHEVS
jgi:hypothetical protein